MNNSKVKKGSNVDRHEYIDNGLIKKEDLEKFLKNIKTSPVIVLEKPKANYSDEIEWIRKILFKDKKMIFLLQVFIHNNNELFNYHYNDNYVRFKSCYIK